MVTRKRAAATLSADSSRMTGRIEKPESRGALMWHNAKAVSKSLLTKIRAVDFRIRSAASRSLGFVAPPGVN